MFKIRTYNQISVKGLERFPRGGYEVGSDIGSPDAFLLRSQTLQGVEVPKSLLAAARAKAHWPQDAAIDAAARAIICPITNWDAYFQPASRALFLRGQQGGGPVGGGSGPFNEGIIFAEQAAAYGGAGGDAAFARWLTRAGTPSAQYVVGQPVTGDVANQFQSAFTSLYPLLTVADYRANPNWQSQVRAIRINHAAWTDDFGPYWNTVFSAGTTKPEFVAQPNRAPPT